MIATSAPGAPRPDPSVDELALASVHSAPEVGRPTSAAEGLGLALGIIGAAAIGGVTMLSLASHRAPPPTLKPSVEAAPMQAASAPVAMRILSPPPRPATLPPIARPASSAASPSPLLVVDNGPPSASSVTTAPKAGPDTPRGTAVNAAFSPDEQFAARAGDEPVPTSHAQPLAHPGALVAQGTLIPAVLETALNSDLPGYARALVSRDVRAFDGSRVLIPRGSRLVGQYKSALQAGQRRAFIVWNRLLTPDGVSIQLGSPTTDDIGQTGLAGKVDGHFFQRFGSAILLSVIDGLAGAIGGSGNNTVVLGSVGSGTAGAAGVALQNQIRIPPTVKVMPGAPIQVFVARDLDFTVDAG